MEILVSGALTLICRCGTVREEAYADASQLDYFRLQVRRLS
jgi:hypothetical protein